MTERQILGMVWPIRQREQGQGSLGQQLITFPRITALTGCDHVVPIIFTSP